MSADDANIPRLRLTTKSVRLLYREHLEKQDFLKLYFGCLKKKTINLGQTLAVAPEM